MKIGLTKDEYNYPLSFFEGAFLTASRPEGCGAVIINNFLDWNLFQNSYYVHYLRYIYFICIQNCIGNYPVDLKLEEINEKLEGYFRDHNRNGGKIKYIVVMEAPPLNSDNYFYSLDGLSGWDAPRSVCGEIIKALGIPTGISKLEFLIRCAKAGFLLLDMLPFPITYPGVSMVVAYSRAIRRAWGFNKELVSYPMNMKATLEVLSCCLSDNFAFAFTSSRVGKQILIDPSSTGGFNKWCREKGFTLIPHGDIEMARDPFMHGRSSFLRICWDNKCNGLHSERLNEAGINWH